MSGSQHLSMRLLWFACQLLVSVFPQNIKTIQTSVKLILQDQRIEKVIFLQKMIILKKKIKNILYYIFFVCAIYDPEILKMTFYDPYKCFLYSTRFVSLC